MEQRRTVFFVSDRTGITAETLGHSLLTQFDGVELRQVTVPFIDSVDKADEFVARVKRTGEEDGVRPIVFSTLIKRDVRKSVQQVEALFLDFFDAFIGPIEEELDVRSSHTSGKAHGMSDLASYTKRIDAMNFALNNDDGVNTHNYSKADVVLVGVSRSGKTPTCLYLALHYGVYAANYPLTEDDLEEARLPPALAEFTPKLFGLTIDATRLSQIRTERRPESRYASSPQVQYEVRATESLFRRLGIPHLDTTSSSIEEIATTIIHQMGLKRRFI